MKVNICGMSSAQMGLLSANKKSIASLSNLLIEMLQDAGYEADYQLEGADRNIVFLLPFGSLNIKRWEEAFEVLANDDNAIIAFDDWNIQDLYRTVDYILSGQRVYKSHPWVKQDRIEHYKSIIQKIADGHYKALFPAFRTGDHELLGIRGEKYAIDPSIYVKAPQVERFYQRVNSQLIPVHASLAKKWSYLEKKKYTILNVREETEVDVFAYYLQYGIVLSPPHYHDGSGWWRNRYNLAHLADALVIEDENSPFGSWYNIQRKDVTPMTFISLLEQQKRVYDKTIMTKEEISERLKEVVK